MHKHHIIPKHMGGSDDPSNLILLTVEEHAEAHKKLYEEHGRWQDKFAWKGLAGLMSKEEIQKESVRIAMERLWADKEKYAESVRKGNRTKYLNGSYKKNSIAMSGEKNHFFGKKHTEESRAKMKKAATGRTYTMSDKGKANIRMGKLRAKMKKLYKEAPTLREVL